MPTTASASSNAATDASSSIASAQPLVTGDAGASACRLVYGPAPQAYRRFGALSPSADGVDVIFNDNGAAHAVHVKTPLPSAKPSAAAPEPPVAGDSSYPPCVATSLAYFCADRSGGVHRVSRAAGGGVVDAVVAHAPAGNRIYAATLARDHAVVAYVASRKSEGDWVSEAFAVEGGSEPLRISEDGTGATSLALAPRGASVLAVLVDARSAMTSVHARALSWDGKLTAGTDAVIGVIGPPEGASPSVVLATQGEAAELAFAVMPIAKDTSSFGALAMRVDDPPKDDEPLAWSLYPSGLDAPPLAASRGGSAIVVARVRPAGDDANAARVLEIGRVGEGGAFVADGLVLSHGAVTDVAVEVDARGTVWLLYADAAGSWLEARICVAPP